MAASFLRTRNGTFYASFYDVERSPKEKRISTGTKDKATARQLLTKWERAWLTGEVDPWHDDLPALLKPKGTAEKATLTDAFDSFIEARKAMNCTANTLRTYGETKRGLLRHANGSRPALGLLQKRSALTSSLTT